MVEPAAPIPIQATDGACGLCVPLAAAARCGGPCGTAQAAEPALSGDLAKARRVLDALRCIPFEAGGPDLVTAGQVRGLRVGDGEAELDLAFPRGCGARRLAAEEAFQVLRRLLPDTDVYVRHAG